MKERSENRLPKPDRPVSAASQSLSQAEDNTDRYRLRGFACRRLCWTWTHSVPAGWFVQNREG